MPNMKSIRLKTKELQNNKAEASDFAISQFRDFANQNKPVDSASEIVFK